MNKQIFTTAFALSALILPLSAEASSFTEFNIFGDSLVDTGNVFNLTGLPPSPPYAEGRFANSQIWIDILAESLNLNPVLSSKLDLETRIPTQGINFAFGGATTGFRNNGGEPLPRLQQQIYAFQDLTTIKPADANALNIIWAGANDYLQALSAPELLTLSLAEQTTDNLSGAVESLYTTGARNFLVVNLPDLGETPVLQQVDSLFPGTASQINDLTGIHNLFLEQKLNNLNASLPGIEVITLDVNSLFREVLNEPSRFGFTNIDSSCLLDFQPLLSFDGICDNPDEFLFWDDIHPTSAAHQLVAQLALDTLASSQERVPEPNNVWGLLLFASLILSWFGSLKSNTNWTK